MATDKSDVDISTEEFQAFFRAHGERPCVECGKTEWAVLSKRPEDGNSMAFPASIPDRKLTDYFPVHLAFCTACGYVKLYSAVVIARWRNSR